MPSIRGVFALIGAAFVLVAINCPSVSAQSTLFNIPSTDVVAPKDVYFEFDFISHLESHEDGGFQTYVPRVVVGVYDRVELGANFAFTDAAAEDIPAEFQPNIKVKLYDGGDNGGAVSAGGILYTPMTNTEGVDTFGLLYLNASKKFSGDYGPRLTGGVYGLVSRDDDLGDTAGAILGYEQPLHKKVNFVVDWLSGENRFGYVTPGLAFTLPNSQVFYAGYSVGNVGRKNNALFLYYGVTF